MPMFLRAIAIVCEVTDFRLGVYATETVQFKLRSLRGFVGRRWVVRLNRALCPLLALLRSHGYTLC